MNYQCIERNNGIPLPINYSKQRSRRFSSIILLVGVFLFSSMAFFYGCSSTIELSSAWRNNEIAIDGNDSDWKNSTAFLDKAKVAVGIRNDDDYLYLCLLSWDRQTEMQIVGLGLTVWFDPEGDNDKIFGIHFPLGMQGAGQPSFPQGGQPNQQGQPDQQAIRQMTESSQQELEIVGPGKKDVQRISQLQVPGIKVRLGMPGEFVVYELKVPLRRTTDHPYAVNVDTGKTISVGFETTESNREMMPQGMEGGGRGGVGGGARGGPGGGGGGGGGMPPGGRGGGGPPSGGGGTARGERPEPLKLWLKVQLAMPQ